MELFQISAIQVAILCVMILLGFTLTKVGLVKIEAKGSISNLLVYLVVPCMIINSYITEFDQEVVTNLLWCFLFTFICFVIVTIFIMSNTFFWKTEQKNILRFAMIFSNAAYMGFPLIQALFPENGIIYASSFVTIFNIYLWTFGYALVSKSFNPKKIAFSILKTPVIYALIIGLIIFFTQAKIPSYVQSTLSTIGNMNTPLSMFLIGMIITQIKFKNIVKNVYMWMTIFFKLVLVPLLSFAIIYIFKITINDLETLMLQVIFILMSCPCVSITSVFAIQFKYDEEVAAGSVVISTLLSLVSLPLFTLMASAVL